MAQVNSENSTTAPVVSTRRRFLSNAAGIAAGGTALALTAPLPAGAATPDPVFAAIERHRELSAAYTAAIDHHSGIELQGIGIHFDKNVEAAADALCATTCSALLDHADTMIITEPTTVAGIAAVLRYFATLEEWQQPHAIEYDDDDLSMQINWQSTFFVTMAKALQGRTA